MITIFAEASRVVLLVCVLTLRHFLLNLSRIVLFGPWFWLRLLPLAFRSWSSCLGVRIWFFIFWWRILLFFLFNRSFYKILCTSRGVKRILSRFLVDSQCRPLVLRYGKWRTLHKSCRLVSFADGWHKHWNSLGWQRNQVWAAARLCWASHYIFNKLLLRSWWHKFAQRRQGNLIESLCDRWQRLILVL